MPTADLAQLKDLHYPEVILWYPPAIGWWLLLILLIALVVFLVVRLRTTSRQIHRKLALAELEKINNQDLGDRDYLIAVNQLLKRLALQVYGTDCATLHGEAWLSFLDAQWEKGSFSAEAGVLLHIYQENLSAVDYDRTRLHVLVAAWIKEHKRGVKKNA